MRPSQNLILPPRIHSPFQQLLYACICDPPKFYSSLPEYTPLFNNYYMYVNATLPKSTPPSQNNLLSNNHKRPYQNLFLPSRINSPFQQLLYMRPSHKLPLLPRIHPPPFQQLYTTLPGSTPTSQNIPLPFSTTICNTTRIYPPFQQVYMCDPPRIYPSLSENTPTF